MLGVRAPTSGVRRAGTDPLLCDWASELSLHRIDARSAQPLSSSSLVATCVASRPRITKRRPAPPYYASHPRQSDATNVRFDVIR